MDTLLPAEKADVLELDELWSFVGSKTQTLWLWMALCRRTRQFVAWTLGDRSAQGACDLRAAIAKDYRHCATRSDLWEAYRAAFSAKTHRCCSKKEGETNHAERWFCTLRQRVGRLVRKSLSFSKRVENYLAAVHFHSQLQPRHSTESNNVLITTRTRGEDCGPPGRDAGSCLKCEQHGFHFRRNRCHFLVQRLQKGTQIAVVGVGDIDLLPRILIQQDSDLIVAHRTRCPAVVRIVFSDQGKK